MALKLVDGRYVLTDRGDPAEAVTDEEKTIERVLFKLKTKRGSFLPIPDLGSRLYLLPREKRADMKNAAFGYVTEALTDESDVTVKDVSVEYTKDGILLGISLSYGGADSEISLVI